MGSCVLTLLGGGDRQEVETRQREQVTLGMPFWQNLAPAPCWLLLPQFFSHELRRPICFPNYAVLSRACPVCLRTEPSETIIQNRSSHLQVYSMSAAMIKELTEHGTHLIRTWEAQEKPGVPNLLNRSPVNHIPFYSFPAKIKQSLPNVMIR